MSFLVGDKKEKSPIKIIFDIGSDSVGGSVVCLLPQTNKLVVQFTVRTPVKFSETADYTRLVEGVVAAFRTTADAVHRFTASKRYHHRDLEIACGLSSIWCAVRVHHLSYSEKKTFTVSSRLIEDMLSGEREEQTNEEKALLQQKHITEPAIFERRILSIALNGYTTTNPTGKRTDRVDLSLFTAVMSLPFYQRLRAVLEEHFEDINVSFHSHALSLLTTTRDCLNARGDFLLIDVGGAVTEMVFVRDDVIARTQSIATGMNTLIESIIQERGNAPQDIHALLATFADLDTSSAEYKAVERAGVSWKQELARTVRSVDGSDLDTHQIFLNAPSNASEWFKACIERPLVETEENSSVSTGKTVMVPSRLIHHFIESEKGVTIDVALAMEALHISRL